MKFYSPDGADETAATGLGEGTAADDAVIGQDRNERTDDAENTAGYLTNAKSDAKADGGDQANVRGGDSTILGAGGAAGGLSGDGERTDEYDAAVMGLDD
ncbi:hypothetical protein [Spirosoma soli]